MNKKWKEEWLRNERKNDLGSKGRISKEGMKGRITKEGKEEWIKIERNND